MTTLTDTQRPSDPVETRSPTMTSPNGSPFARYAGPLAVVAGILITLAQLVMLPYDPKDHIRTSQSLGFQVGGAIFMAGFVALLLAAIGAHERQNHKSGRLSTVSAFAVVTGTMMLGGDLWFETFAMPWIADSPTAGVVFDSDPTVMLGLGALSSYLLFAIGWALFGIASLRTRVLPRTISVAIVITGIIGFQSLLSPFAIPLALSVTAMGIWFIRNGDRHPGRANQTA
jgi:hypothetical protein